MVSIGRIALTEPYPYPVFLRLGGRKCVVVGGGTVASRKVSELLDAGADVTVIADIPNERLEALAEANEITLQRRAFESGDMDGAFIVFAATDDDEVNAEIASLGSKSGALVNAVDNPPHCDFFSAGVLKRGPLRIAVSTSGFCPAAASTIRRELETQYGESYGEYLVYACDMRQYVLRQDSLPKDTKDRALKWLGQKETYTLYIETGKDGVWAELEKIISC